MKICKYIGKYVISFYNLLFFLCLPLSISGQNTIFVKGIVEDQMHERMPGVTVSIPGTNTGTVTDVNGCYSINVPNNTKELMFSFVGYQTLTVPIDGKQLIDVTMKEEAIALDELVVVGYGVQKKESSVAAITQVNGDALLQSSATSVSGALAGQVPGITTIQSSGQPGADNAQILIRGVSSWVSNEPMVMVDGVERNFNDIDPNEIETLSVLKDASATAIFGIRGANGVILITTKRGQKGKVKVNASAEITAKQPIGMETPMSSYQTALVMNEAYKNDNNWGSIIPFEKLEHYRLQDMPYMYPNTNWQKELIKDVAFSQKYNVNISGGTDRARVFASLSYTREGDIIKTKKQPMYDPTYRYDRYNYRFNLDADLTKTTTLSLDAGGYIGIKNSPYETSALFTYRGLATLGPMDIPLYYPASVLEEYPDDTRPDEYGDRLAATGLPNMENPALGFNYSGSRQVKTTNINSNIKLKQDLSFITKGLSATAKVAYNHTVSYNKGYPYNPITYRLREDGSWIRYKGRKGDMDGEAPENPVFPETEVISGGPFRTWYYEISLNYIRTFGKHDVSALLLGQRRQTQTDVDFPRYEEGLVGRITYNYNKRYLTELNLGYNGSEQFSPQKRYGLFPSLALGWNLHHESFFKPLLPIINRAKIRYSYGEVGSDASTSRWLYTSSYINGNNGVNYYPGTAGSPGPSRTTIIEELAANENATWEKAIKQDIGIELEFFNSMFVLNLDFYKERRSQILLTRKSVPDWFGVGMKQQNLGETKTQGYEIDLKFQQTTSGGFYYWLKPSISFSDNRIVERDEPMNKPAYQKEAGKRIFQPFGYQWTGMIQNPDEQMNSLRYGSGLMGLGDSQWVDFNGDGVISELDKVPIGYSTLYPLYNFSLGGGFRYKNFELTFLFQGVTDISKVVIDSYSWPLQRLSNKVFDYQLDAWSPNNRDAQYNAFHFDANRIHNNIDDNTIRATNIYDGSYIRLKTLSLSYAIPKRAVKKMGLNKLQIFIRGNNLFTWSPNYPLADPEASDGGNSNWTSWGYYPMLRRVTLGTQIAF